MAKKPKTTRRGGTHQKLAYHIMDGFAAGRFDVVAWAEYGRAQVYATPQNHTRNGYATAFMQMASSPDDTWDMQETLLYGEDAYNYIIWNRKIANPEVYELRQLEFARIAAEYQEEHDDDADVAVAESELDDDAAVAAADAADAAALADEVTAEWDEME